MNLRDFEIPDVDLFLLFSEKEPIHGQTCHASDHSHVEDADETAIHGVVMSVLCFWKEKKSATTHVLCTLK